MKKTKYFTENWALVEEDGKVYMSEFIIRDRGFRSGIEFIPISNRYDKIGDFDENRVAIVKHDGLYGLINEKGEEICKPEYQGIRHIFSKYFHAYNWGVRSNIIDAHGNIMCEYKNIYDPVGCEVAIVDFDDGSGIIDSECREIHRRKYEKLGFLESYFQAQIGTVLVIINYKGEEVLKIENGKIYKVEDGYFGIEADGKYGRLNPKGELIIPVEYVGICKMKDDIFDAIIECDKKDYSHRKVQQFDKNGRKIGKEFWKKY